MLDLNAMALFTKVVEYRSFSETSKRLGVPISTVSRKVSTLEKELGVRLLERSTRRLRLTVLGQDYYEYCRRGLEEIESGTLMINDRQAEVSGTLRLSVPPSLTDVLIIPLIGAFQAVYPNAFVRAMVTDRKVDLIEEGVDLALRAGELDDSSLVARRLLAYRHVLVASPGYLARAGAPRHPGELNGRRLVAFSAWHRQNVWALTNDGTTENITVEGAIALNDYAGIRRAVVENMGIAEIPSIICGRDIENGALVEVLPEWRFAPTKLSAVYPSSRNISRLVQLFRDFCVEHIEKLAPYSGI